MQKYMLFFESFLPKGDSHTIVLRNYKSFHGMKATEMKLNKSRKKINIEIEITQNSMELHLPFSNPANFRITLLKCNSKKSNV